MAQVLTTPDEVTIGWLTDALRRNGFISDSEVISARITLTKTLSRSTVSRLVVTYSKPVELPSQFFLKIARSNPKSSDNPEIEFYQTLARQINGPPLVRCYDSAYSSELGWSHLLLEDLSETHFQPSSPQAPSLSNCELAVESLAEVHATWWNHPQLGKQVGSLFTTEQLDQFIETAEKDTCRFIDFLRDKLTRQQRDIYERLLELKEKIWGHLRNPHGLTVTHGDAHWWNLLYPHELNKDRVRIVDWQLWHVDLGPRDIAFMVGLGGYAERVAETEQGLVRHYFNCLVTHGVTNYNWDDCWHDYRMSAFRNLNIPVIQWSQGQSSKLWGSNLKRALRAYEELRLHDLLNG